jgi:hypothetical protein
MRKKQQREENGISNDLIDGLLEQGTSRKTSMV